MENFFIDLFIELFILFTFLGVIGFVINNGSRKFKLIFFPIIAGATFMYFFPFWVDDEYIEHIPYTRFIANILVVYVTYRYFNYRNSW